MQILIRDTLYFYETLSGNSALHYASWKGYKDVIDVFVANNANIEIRGTDGQTPLMEGSYKGQLDVVKKLLDLGADPSLEVLNGPYSGKTACLMAKLRNVTDIVQFFKSEGLEWTCNEGPLKFIKYVLQLMYDFF